MEADIAALPVIHVDMVQAVALAVIMYGLGTCIKRRIGFLARYTVPRHVVGGMTFAFVLSLLEGLGIVRVEFDATLQTQLMLAFFTTLGLMASLRLLKTGGRLLVGFLAAAAVLGLLQNVVGSSVASLLGIDPRYGILAGSVSLMGGLGTSAAFGPYFESTYGLAGGTAAAISSATFGMVVALIIGAPFGEWLIRRYRLPTTAKVKEPEPKLHIPEEVDIPVSEIGPMMTRELMHAVGVVSICMALGMIVSQYLAQYITLPAYIGSMIVAAIVRNIADFTGKFRADGRGITAVADISLILFVTMSINSLRLLELVHLAVPLLIILAVQTCLMLAFAFFVIYRFFGRDYDAVMLSAGSIGFSMGATANALANMQALAEKYGPSPQAWFVVSIVGAFLIDFINALTITWFGSVL